MICPGMAGQYGFALHVHDGRCCSVSSLVESPSRLSVDACGLVPHLQAGIPRSTGIFGRLER